MTGYARQWLFTTNNPRRGEAPGALGEDDSRPTPGVLFCVWQLECGAGGTPHFQGFVALEARMRLAQLQRACVWLARSHLEVRRGTMVQAIDYCTKADTRLEGPWEFGERPGGQGRCVCVYLCWCVFHTLVLCRSKPLAAACASVRAGTRVHELPEELDAVFVLHHRGLRELRSSVVRASVPVFREVKTCVLWGDTGLGKTRFAVAGRDTSMVFILDQPGGSTLWFDGYDGQRVLVIDDFQGLLCLAFVKCLTVCCRMDQVSFPAAAAGWLPVPPRGEGQLHVGVLADGLHHLQHAP